MILVAEDDESLNELICLKLKNEGFNAKGVFNAQEAIEILQTKRINLLITDIMMPGISGHDLAKQAKLIDENLPILMITAKSEFSDMQTGFLSGADDYMSKPLNLKEMILRINALLRRAKIANSRQITLKSTKLDYDNLRLSIQNSDVTLTPKEFYTLFLLLKNEGKIFTRFEIMQEIWGFDSQSDERVVDTHIKKIRAKVKHADDFEIVTIRTLGYKAKIL